LTGVRIGIILQAVGAAVTALIIAFIADWKLALVVLCFVPLMMFSGKIQGQKQGKAGQSRDKDSFTEQGGQVLINNITFLFPIHFVYIYFFAVCHTSNRTYSYCRCSSSRKPFY